MGQSPGAGPGRQWVEPIELWAASLLLSPPWPLLFGYFCDPCSYSVPIRGRSVLQRGPPFWSWRDL